MKTRWLKLASVLGVMAGARLALRHMRKIDLRGKVALITGGSRGLGLVMARALVDRGARVALCARDADELARAKAELAAIGGEVYTAVCDVTDRDAILELVTAIEDDFGPIELLINNAGIIQVGPLETMTADDFEQALDVNLRGPLHASLAVLPAMRKRKAGRIVNIASIGGKIAMPHLAPYATSKFALVGLSEAMRAELAPDNIFVTTVCPGLMRTGSTRHAWFKGKARAEYAWFTVGDSLSLTSVSAEDAASQILRAAARGDAELIISPQAKLAALAHGIAPGWMQELLSVVARVLPGAPKSAPMAATQGKDLEVPLPSVLTRQADDAALRNNQA
jgi:short-subunit dehydrogenase